MYLVTAYFDKTTDLFLMDVIKKCSRISGNNFMTKNNVPPHLTLLQFQTKSSQEMVMEKYQEIVFPRKSIHIEFGCPESKIPGVVDLSLKKDCLGQIDEINGSVFDKINPLPTTLVNRFYIPQNFYPHVTLAKTLTDGQKNLMEAFLKNQSVPRNSKIVSISLTVGKPAVELYRVELGQ